MHGVIRLSPPYIFMAWCWIYSRDNFNLSNLLQITTVLWISPVIREFQSLDFRWVTAFFIKDFPCFTYKLLQRDSKMTQYLEICNICLFTDSYLLLDYRRCVNFSFDTTPSNNLRFKRTIQTEDLVLTANCAAIQKIPSNFKEPEGSSPCSQESSTGFYPEPDRFSPTIPSYLNKIHFIIVHSPTSWSS
jgi:hypothetical protein